MPLAQGRPYVAIPGPSVMPDRVLAAMHRPAPDIYAGPLHEMTASLYPDLRAVARTRHHVAIYIGNGHAAWEAANANLFSRGDLALVLVTGQFGTSWANSVERMGVRVERIDYGRQRAADPARLAEALAADRAHEIRAVLVTHVDTATTVRNDVAALRAALDAAGHPALLAVDCIASLACEPFEMDLWGADVVVAASQKGLMTPPGLGFVFFNDRARDRCRGANLRTPYWDWTPRAFGEEYWQLFCGTAPTHHLYGLRVALDMILKEEGIEAVWARHGALAQAVWAAVEAWGQGGDIALNVPEASARGWSVTSVRMGGGQAERLRAWCAAETGVTLGIGLSMPVEADHLRIAHMGHVNAHMTLGALAAMETGMRALGIAHGRGGVDAAMAALAQA